jgi:hypothetical protein
VRKAPDSNRLRGTDEWLIMDVLPGGSRYLYTRHVGTDAGGFPNGNFRYFSAHAQLETCVTAAAPAECPRRPASSRISAS